MIIQFARIFSSSVYRGDPYWREAINQMAMCTDEETLAQLDDIEKNSSYIHLTPAVYKEFDTILASKNVTKFFILFDALKYPVFSASLICVLLRDIDFLKTLIKQLSAQKLQRPKTTMGLLRNRWMEIVAKQILEKDVKIGQSVETSVSQPIEGILETQLTDDLKEMLKILGAEEMFRWAIEIKQHRIIGEVVQYESDTETVAFNRLRLFVLDKLPELVNLDSMKMDGNNLPYTLYLLRAYVHLKPVNTTRMNEFLDLIFKYLQCEYSPTCCNEEIYNLILPVAKAYALCRNRDNKELLSLIDCRRINKEGWRVNFHHKVLEDDDVNTDVITWPQHFMPREQQEVIANLIAWYLLGENSHFANAMDTENYFDAIASKLFSQLRQMNRNDLHFGCFGFSKVICIAYQQTCQHLSSKKEEFVNRLMISIDTLYHLYMFLYECQIALSSAQKKELRKRFKNDWLGERKVEEILKVYDKCQLDEVEAGLKKVMK